MPVKKSPRRHYTSKKPAKHYLKVYWPYLPTLISLLTVIVIGGRGLIMHATGVLGYATNTTHQGLLTATNAERSQHGQAALSLNQQLSQAAQAKAEDMVARDYWSHVTPDGNQPWIFIEQAGYNYQKAGENLAYGFANSDATIAGWMNSATHRDNLLDGAYKEVGFGFANSENYQDSGPQTVVVAMYGVAAATTPATTPEPAAESVANRNPAPAEVAEETAPAEQAEAIQVDRSETSTAVVTQQSSPQRIAAVQALTDGNAPWSGFAVGLLVGGLLVYLILRHSLAIKRGFIKSERFLMNHPLFDILLVSLVVIGLLLSQTAGVIR